MGRITGITNSVVPPRVSDLAIFIAPPNCRVPEPRGAPLDSTLWQASLAHGLAAVANVSKEHTHGTGRVPDQSGGQGHRGVEEHWLIIKNGDQAIGLFHGMFETNVVTFNPGWDSNAQTLASFTDVRDLQRQLKAQGVQLLQEANEKTTGPASFVAVDPDSNQILVDQHV